MQEQNADHDLNRRIALAHAAYNAGRVAEAAQLFTALTRDFPTHAPAHANLGVMLRRLGKIEAAVVCYHRALALTPDNPGVLSSLGNALRALGRLTEAEKAQARALQLAPAERSLRYNYALTLHDMRKVDEALRILSDLHAQNTDDPEIAWDLAITQLRAGDYANGFKGYEARWRLPRNETKLCDGPQWAGENISGKRILLQSEQGFGDALQFARYVPLVAARGARVVVECLSELRSLFAAISGVEEFVIKGNPSPPVDLSIPLLSLPRVFGTTLATIPAQVPYLRAPYTMNLPQKPGTHLRVGLVWAGKPTPHDRSWPLQLLAPLLDNPHIAFFSLQTGPRAGELAGAGFDQLIIDLAPQLQDFADTAAAMAALDLVITVDTASAHLAGALGRPTFVLLHYVSDWRWLDDREDSPWYPTLRLIRQSRPDDFARPVECIHKELRHRVEFSLKSK
jgi:Flp pilus assembly protein TadD